MALSRDGHTLYTSHPLRAYVVADGSLFWRREDVTAWSSALDINARGACWPWSTTGRETGLDRAIDFACQMAGRNLTEAKWEQFLPAQPYQSVCPQD